MLITKRYQGCAEQTERTKIEFGDMLNLRFSEPNTPNLTNVLEKILTFEFWEVLERTGLASFSRTNGNSHKWDSETVFFTK